jgi:hypothetical protein
MLNHLLAQRRFAYPQLIMKRRESAVYGVFKRQQRLCPLALRIAGLPRSAGFAFVFEGVTI